jgi:hypothetical protein
MAWRRWSGGDLFVKAEMLFDGGNADFELEAFVDLAFLELGQLGVEAIDFTSEVGFDAVDLCVEFFHAAVGASDVVGDRGEALIYLSFEICEAALDGREDAVERRLALLGRLLFGCGGRHGQRHGKGGIIRLTKIEKSGVGGRTEIGSAGRLTDFERGKAGGARG